jgi:ribosomal protein L7/L12
MLFAELDSGGVFLLVAALAPVAIIAILVFANRTVIREPSDKAHLRRLEVKLDLLLRHFGIEIPDPATAAGLSAEVRQLANDGKKIQAIKVHREQTGLGLKDAKEAVEAYMAR